MMGEIIGEVIRSNSENYKVGEIVLSKSGWQMFSIADESTLKKVDKNVLQKLNNYLKFVSNNVALRQQSKLPRNVALYLAKCNSNHRDLSIYF